MIGIGAITGLASLAAGAVQGGIKIAQANKQNRQAEELRKQFPRPTYQIPEGINQSTNIARMLSLQGLPGQNLALDQLRQSSASGVRAVTDLAQDPAAKAAMAAGLYSQEMNQVNQLNMADAQARTNNLQSLGSAYGILAEYQDKKFDVNQMQPYNNAMAAASALTGASMQNKMGGTEDILSGVTSAAISGVNDVKNAQMAQQIAGQASAQADAAAAVSNLGTMDRLTTSLGGLGTPTSPTVPVQTAPAETPAIDISSLTDFQIAEMPEFAEYAKGFPFATQDEVIQKFKVYYGMM
jgi:hypothetical protein